MRITLLHNSSAGSEDHSDDSLVAAIRAAGHEVVNVVSTLAELTEAIRARPAELVVIAGGDGTVGRAACELASANVPLAILPLGTANNTALALGVRGETSELAQSWPQGRLRGFDLGRMTSRDTQARFSEATGWGIFPHVIAQAKRMASPEDPRKKLERDRRLFLSAAETARPRRYEIEVDGVDYSGSYLLVEVLNIPFIGPQLQLSPSSVPSDGKFELVLAGESERAALLELARTGCCQIEDQLPCKVARRVIVRSGDTSLHRDGSICSTLAGLTELSIEVHPAAVQYLLA